MATAKRRYSAKPKTNVEDTGAMDEFLGTVVGETVKEEDIVEKKPKQAKKPTEKVDTVSQNNDENSQEDAEAVSAPDEPDTESDSEVDAGGCGPWLNEVKMNRITAIVDGCGNVLYYKVPSECVQASENKRDDDIENEVIKVVAEDIYINNRHEQHCEEQELVGDMPVDITPETVAPKPVFPFRIVDKW